jgi:hypothetical protein
LISPHLATSSEPQQGQNPLAPLVGSISSLFESANLIKGL